jgi:hypothetical protein
MVKTRPLHPHFDHFLGFKEKKLIDLYLELRKFMLEIHPKTNEMIYNTHALTSVYSLSARLSEAYCMIPIYSNHLNLGFNKGTLLNDPKKLLQGTGKLIRHIPITTVSDFNNAAVKSLILQAIKYEMNNIDPKLAKEGTIISKIKMN